MLIGVNSPTIEHISRGIVHGYPPESPPLEKVPVTDPELRRIRQRSDALRREMLRTQGLTDIAVDLVRESRDEG